MKEHDFLLRCKCGKNTDLKSMEEYMDQSVVFIKKCDGCGRRYRYYFELKFEEVEQNA